MRISDWSSDVCSSDLLFGDLQRLRVAGGLHAVLAVHDQGRGAAQAAGDGEVARALHQRIDFRAGHRRLEPVRIDAFAADEGGQFIGAGVADRYRLRVVDGVEQRSEEQTSELQSLMRLSYAFSCLQ